MRLLTDFRDHEIIEIFDIFDSDSIGGICFDDVIRFIFLWGQTEFDL